MKQLSVLFTFSFIIWNASAQEFITRWDLTSGMYDTISFGLVSTGPVNYSWETIPPGSSGSGVINGTKAIITGMPAGSTVRLKIDPVNFSQFKDVEQWGAVHWTSMEAAFLSCAILNISATDIPDLSSVKSTNWMFKSCYKLNGPTNINDWNMQMVEDMTEMFSYASAFNQDVGNWNTSSVQKMRGVFSNASSFNQDLGNWNTGMVQDMRLMFSSANSFNQNLENWNTSSVSNMLGMFLDAISFNQSIGNWNISKVTDMSLLFDNSGMDCSNYAATLEGWSENNSTPFGIKLGAKNIYYDTLAMNDRAFLINSKGWTIIGDAPCGSTSVFETPPSDQKSILIPSPVRDQVILNVSIRNNQKATITVLNNLGHIVFQDSIYLYSGDNSYTIDSVNWANGVYVVCTKAGATPIINRIVVAK